MPRLLFLALLSVISIGATELIPSRVEAAECQCRLCRQAASKGILSRIGRGFTSSNRPTGSTLPRARRNYKGRYFGPFNNRFYGPQYGNF